MDELERLTPGGQALEELLHLPEFLLQEPYQAFRGKTEEKSPHASGGGNGKVAILKYVPSALFFSAGLSSRETVLPESNQ